MKAWKNSSLALVKVIHVFQGHDSDDVRIFTLRLPGNPLPPRRTYR